MKSLILSFTMLLCCVINTYSQDLPRFMTIEEQLLVESGEYQPPRIVSDELRSRTPSSMRTMAEWEELQAIAITWRQHPAILTEIVRAAVEEVKVIIFYQGSLQSIKDYLLARGVDPEFNIDYVQSSTNTIWIRDYGANPVYINDVDTLALVDWIYNRPRPADDQIPVATASHLNVPLFSTTSAPNDLVHTGGNFMGDGLGTGFSSMLVLDENGPFGNFGQSDHDEIAVDAIMEEYMGITEYPKMTNLPFDLIHHIDMHMKLLDEETLLVGEYPPGIADGPQIEANIQYLISLFSTAHGKPFKLKRIPMPPDQFGRYPNTNGYYRTYTNSLFINKTIIVPTYEEKYDTTALRMWREMMPGYKIVGINCNAIIPSAGALHCITKEVGVNAPLWITHEQSDSTDLDAVLSLTARVQHRTGIQNVTLFLKQPMDENFVQYAMTSVDGNEYRFDVVLDGVEGMAQYYFHAVANDGKEISRPIVAPDGYFTLKIHGQTTDVVDISTNWMMSEIYPNPADQIAYLDLTLVNGLRIQVDLIDVMGKNLFEVFGGEKSIGQHRIFIQTTELPTGVYFIRMQDDEGGHAIKKLIIR